MQYKILAVDDNPINLDLIQKSLVDTSYQIITTTSGEEALKIAVDKIPDLILLDVMMPGIDGFTVCKRLKENEITRPIPIIFLSAKIRPEDKARGLAIGGIDYLSKPFNSLELNARIRAHISSRRQSEDDRAKFNDVSSSHIDEIQAAVQSQSLTDVLVSLESLWDSNILEEYGSFVTVSRVNSVENPTLIALKTYQVSADQLILLSFMGLEKSIRCKVVQFMLQSFVSGFIDGVHEQKMDSNQTINLFETILREFSPDRLRVGFTFSLAMMDSSKQKFQLFSVHQPSPYIIKKGKKLEKISGTSIPLHGNYNEFVSTAEVPVAADSAILFMIPEPDNGTLLKIQQEMLNDMIWAEKAKHKLDEIAVRMLPKDQDHLIAFVKIRSANNP
jgi:CheY-like chemotaxis protein